VAFHNSIVRRQRLEFVGGGTEWQSGEVSNILGHVFRISLRGVDACTHGGTAKSKFRKMVHRVAECFEPIIKLGYITRKLLSKGERRRIHQVGTADFDDAGKGF